MKNYTNGFKNAIATAIRTHEENTPMRRPYYNFNFGYRGNNYTLCYSHNGKQFVPPELVEDDDAVQYVIGILYDDASSYNYLFVINQNLELISAA